MSVPGGPICKACTDCLSHLFMPDVALDRYPHLNLEGVRQAASKGCHLCPYIKLAMEEVKGCCEAVSIPFEFYMFAIKDHAYLEIYYKCTSAVKELVTFQAIKADACEMPPPMPEASRFGQTTRSAHCQALARKWMQSCVASHSCCVARMKRSSNLDSSQLPTRLLDLWGAHVTRNIRVVHSKTQKIDGPYVTLSHCWGRSHLVRLTSTNIKRFCRSIKMNELPQTFRNAIEICGWYNFRYIWIDSLCIIQDSKADWEMESAAMERIYSHGILNIAASSAIDSSRGLFERRNPHLQLPLVLEIPNYGTCALYLEMETLSDSITNGPLASRGWVLQEWLLAPRVLHCGKQLFWECPEKLACETFPSGTPDRSRIEEPAFFLFKRCISLLTSTVDAQLDQPQSNTDLYWEWRNICQQYSSRDLSVGSDKIIAFGGVANLVKSILPTDTYLAGLWKSKLISDMCWVSKKRRVVWSRSDVGKTLYSGKPTRPPEYGAPSWSWMSVDNVIYWRPFIDESRELAVLCWPDRRGTHEEGSGERSSITVLGVLRPATWKIVQDLYGENQFQFYLDGIKALNSENYLDITSDDLVNQTFPVEEIFFLPLLATNKYAPPITGIILCQVAKSQFRRLGYFELYDYAPLGCLFFELKPPATILNDPWNYFREYAEENKTVEEVNLFSNLFSKYTPAASNTEHFHEHRVWQVPDIQQALGPYDHSMFQPLAAQEIQII